MASRRVTLLRPDDWHHHFRDGARLSAVAPLVARHFGRALAMPNLRPPVVDTAGALAYRERIMAAVSASGGEAGESGASGSFTPLMTLYLTDRTTPEEIDRAAASGAVKACKLYPAGATTNSDSGVTDIGALRPTLERMAARGLLLCVHGEVTDPSTDLFDRERLFIERHLAPLVADLPKLKIVMEHITTEDAVRFVSLAGPNVAATITAHHLLYNRNAIFQGGVRPHMYCLPVLKRERHRQALLAAVKSGNPKFFLGTDSAPHARMDKESACGCAGVFTAHAAIELYAEAFDSVGALDKLEGFASMHGPDFYGLPRNTDTLTLEEKAQPIAPTLPFGDAGEELVPLRAGESVAWTVLA